ncbi:MAG: spinster family MFS transporter [Sphingomonadaceae bacterium]
MGTAISGKEGVARRGYRVTLCLGAVYALNFMDRKLVSILAEPIKQDLKLSDTQIGLLTGLVFALFYSLLALPVARLADRVNRVRLISICCGIWSLFTLCCGLATGFLTLALARVGVALGEAGGSPSSYSIIADYFPPRQRATALGIYSLGVPVGVVGGALVGGWLAADFGWRAAFVIVGLGGLLIAPLILLAVKEPVRGQMDQAPTGELEGNSFVSILGQLMSSPVLLFTGLGAGLGSFTGYALLAWVPSFLMRNGGMTLQEIAIYYSVVSGLSLGLGTWLGGFLTDRGARRSMAAYGAIPALAAVCALPFLLLALSAQSWPAALALIAVPLLLGILYLPPAIAVLQNELPAHARATGSAILLLWFNLVGLGGGPLYVGLVSDALAAEYGAQSLVHALGWLAPFYLLAALCQFAAARALRAKERADQLA